MSKNRDETLGFPALRDETRPGPRGRQGKTYLGGFAMREMPLRVRQLCPIADREPLQHHE